MRATLFFTCAVCALSSACVDSPPSAPPLTSLGASESAAAQYIMGLDRPHERMLHAIADETPGFAGFERHPDGELTLLVTHLEDVEVAGAALAQRLAPRLGRSAAELREGMHSRIVPYGFKDLSRWRDLVSSQLWLGGHAGVITVDLQEDKGLVEIGILTGEEGPALAKRLAEMGVPEDAVMIVEAQLTVPDRAPIRGADYLTDRWDTIMSGIRHTFRDAADQNAYACTVGITVSGQFLVASHCTAVPFFPDTAAIYQVTLTPANQIGSEAWDPPFAPGGCWPLCRWSDAALVSYTGARPLTPGLIAKPVSRSPSGGSLFVDQSVIGLEIEGEVSNPIKNDVVDKIGQATGWSYGTVVDTCKEITDVSGMKLLCQDKATYGRGNGDSGAPVFIEFMWGISVVGMHAQSQGGYAYFSSVANIEEDLSTDLFIGPYPH